MECYVKILVKPDKSTTTKKKMFPTFICAVCMYMPLFVTLRKLKLVAIYVLQTKKFNKESLTNIQMNKPTH